MPREVGGKGVQGKVKWKKKENLIEREALLVEVSKIMYVDPLLRRAGVQLRLTSARSSLLRERDERNSNWFILHSRIHLHFHFHLSRQRGCEM